MLFWKRVEIYCGYSLKEFTDLKDSLASKGIPYDYKVVEKSDRTKRYGTLRQNQKYDRLYYLYIHHKDYDHAMHITSNRHVN